ncbi:MAG: hypothetical protein R2700_16245 [Solirubrobacterales bacterium]
MAGQRAAPRCRLPRHLPGDQPDPVAVPGITQERTGERIDYVYAAGLSETLDSKLIGEPGGEDADIEKSLLEPDHRAVLDLRGDPAEMPRLVAVDAPRDSRRRDHRQLERPGIRRRDEVAVLLEGADPADAVETLDASAPAARGRSTPPAGSRAPTRPCCSTPTAVRSPASPSICAIPEAELDFGTDKSVYEEGEPVRVSDRRLRQPLGLARRLRGVGPRSEDGQLPDLGLRRGPFRRDRSAADGRRGVLGPNSQGSSWPLPPGDYVVHYLLADQYDSAGSAEFTVAGD